MEPALKQTFVQRFAQAGLLAKGVLYCLMGLIAFMAAFQIGGRSTRQTDVAGVLDLVRQTGGQIMLALLTLGLFCYCGWRLLQAFADTDQEGREAKGLAKRGLYLLSALAYASVAIAAARLLLNQPGQSGGDSKQTIARTLLEQPFGQLLAGIVALIFIGTGVYQLYYGFREKFRKHAGTAGRWFIAAGKIGYCARGIVWLILGWLFAKAAWKARASAAGDTSKAMGWLSDGTWGTWLLAAVGLGLACYGLFNFVRARHERSRHY